MKIKSTLSLFLAAIVLCTTLVFAQYDVDEDENEPYETDFIRGFEEGLQTRQFYRQIYEETGEIDMGEQQHECQLPKEASPKEKAAYERIKNAVNNSRAFLTLDAKMDAAFDMILEFIATFYKFVAILTPAYDEQQVTEYCLGF